MLKITGFDDLTQTFEQAQRALADVDGRLGSVSFDPHDPASIEAAIQPANIMVDEQLGAYSSNPLVAPMIQADKEHFRAALLEQASAARLKSENKDGPEV